LFFWGGSTIEQNHHYNDPMQRYALDLVIMDKQGRTFRTDGTENSDYYAYGQRILAPLGEL